MTKYTLLLLALASSLLARTQWYEIDYSKSQISFLAKSRIVNANGIFRKWTFKGKIQGNFHAVGDLALECASIDTDNDRRDSHLRNADFFDCEKNAEHVFRITGVKPDQAPATKATKFQLSGTLTMHGITEPIEITLTRDGDDAKLMLSGSVIIDREKFGLTYNSALNPIEKLIRLDIRLQLVRREK